MSTRSRVTSARRRISMVMAAAVLALATVATSLASSESAEAQPAVVMTSTGVQTHGAITTTKYKVGWLLECRYSHTAADDPIVHPGMAGMSHLHDFFGNRSTTASSTGASLAAGRSTTCDTQADTSAYWTPSLFVNGRRITPMPSSQQIYYRALYAPGVVVEPMPTDLRLVVGTMMGTSVATNPALAGGAIRWECSGSSRTYVTPPACGRQPLVENVAFPSCWDGVLTHTNDSAHVTRAVNMRCPAGFPHALPMVSLKVKYSIPAGGRITLSSGSVYTAHADLLNGWQSAGMRYLVTHCMNAHISCGTSPLAPVGA